ncbi:unnamed protein product [Plutella xylostella]|uniref:(diamondback moth) hypothetical protein n=1 Tax=Plutella xylostella TaxID=51655 RepID=A0A8S4EK45_PLUXY|nr:unnamed protein product [Plutella xylostella]
MYSEKRVTRLPLFRQLLGWLDKLTQVGSIGSPAAQPELLRCLTAVVGSRVTLPCRVEHKSGQLQWTKDDFGLGLQRDLSGYERYRMIGSDEEGIIRVTVIIINQS